MRKNCIIHNTKHIILPKPLRGFGLIEVMVAVTILVTVVVAVFALNVKTSQAAILARDKVVAYNLAQFMMEGMRNTEAKCFEGGFTQTNCPYANSIQTIIQSGISYQVEAKIEDFNQEDPLIDVFLTNYPTGTTANYLIRNIKKYIVTVSWQGAGRTNSVQYSTFFTNWKE